MNEITTTAASKFDIALRQSDLLAKSELVPKTFQNKPENCMIALELADRMNTSAFMLMQNLDIIHGKPAFSAKFLIGCFNACGRFEPIRYEHDDADGGRTRAVSSVRATGEPIHGPWVSMVMAKAEGWVSKNGSKWQTMPELMRCYRAAAFMIRTTAPEISLGLPTTEEVHDVEVRDVTPRNPFVRELPAPAPDAAVPEPEPTPHEQLRGLIDESGATVKDVITTLATMGIGDGKTPPSKMPEETVAKIVADWGTLAGSLKGGDA